MPPVSSKKRSITNRSVVGSAPSSAKAGREVGDDLLGHLTIDPGELLDERDRQLPARSGLRSPLPAPRSVASTASLSAETASESSAVRRRRLAEPERHRRRRPFRVHDPDRAGLDPADPPRCAAEEEDVAGHGLDRPVLVDGADERLLRLEHDPVVGDVGDRATGRERP